MEPYIVDFNIQNHFITPAVETKFRKTVAAVYQSFKNQKLNLA